MYLIALSVVASTILFGQFGLHIVMGHMEHDSAVINTAGKQRMLSQRVASKSVDFVARWAAGDLDAARSARLQMEAARNEWRSDRRKLLERDESAGLGGRNSERVKELCWQAEPHFLAALDATDQLLRLDWEPTPSDQAHERAAELTQKVVRETDHFLPLMDRIVGTYEHEAKAELGVLRWIELSLASLALLVLVLEACFIFEPSIRRLARSMRDLEVARDAADQANEIRGQFLANMSHEIRTPMTSILGYTEILASNQTLDPDESATMVESVRSNAKHLLSIINDILDLSKIEAGKMTLEHLSVSPAGLIEEAAELFRPEAIGKGLELNVRYETAIPESIWSDPTRLKQIVLNLVGNAVKFTERGSVTIRVSCDAPLEQMQIRVVDTGIGMTPEQRERVARFGAFEQSDMTTTRRYGGTGLGLRISHGLATQLGGGIEIRSAAGRGSEFVLTINTGPLGGVRMLEPGRAHAVPRACGSAMHAPSDTEDLTQPLHGVHVLVIEDGVDNQRLIHHHLTRAGARVTMLENGQEAVDLFLGGKDVTTLDVVLMDMQMPVLDGYEATRRLRQSGVALPIVALTAHALDGEREKCLGAGCNDYLTKPYEVDRLIDRCVRWTPHSRERRTRRAG